VVYPPIDAGLSITMSDFDPREPHRVCRECYATLGPMQETLQQTITHSAMPVEVDRSSIERYLNSPVGFSLTAEVAKAAHTLLNFTGDNAIEGADSIPRDLILDARGLAFITFIKAGVFFTGRFGTGLVVSRRSDGSWSAPSAIGSVGVGWGFQLGGGLTDVVIVLNTVGAVEAFSGKGQVSLGTELGISVGPLGRTASSDVRAGDGGVTAAFSYAHSKGIFIGVSLEAATVFTRNHANRDFYGGPVTARDLLLGDHPPPRAAGPLYRAIAEVEGIVQQPHPPPHSATRAAGWGWGQGQGQEVGFAPFNPDSEAKVRRFTLSESEREQMREDYNMALALQREEAANLGRRVSSSPRPSSSLAPRDPSILGRVSNFFTLSASGSEQGTSGDDTWGAERSRRLEKGRQETGELLQGSELGEMRGSSSGGGRMQLNGVDRGGQHRDRGVTGLAAGSQGYENGRAGGVLVEDEEEEVGFVLALFWLFAARDCVMPVLKQCADAIATHRATLSSTVSTYRAILCQRIEKMLLREVECRALL
ncbi:unnamed protein product, partial [Discosporangium mesarthrocarpum]